MHRKQNKTKKQQASKQKTNKQKQSNENFENLWTQGPITVNCRLEALGLYNFVRVLGGLINGGAYIRGGF